MKNRNHILIFLVFFSALVTCCSKMYDNVEKYAGETVYPGKFDTIVGHIGYNRVELDLAKEGRIPSNKMYLGKATKTVVSYEDKTFTLDSLVSWVNIPDLKESKLYRFKAYTLDGFGNASVPQEIALIPYTESDVSLLVVQSPQIEITENTAKLSWAAGLSSILLDYYGLTYSYKNKDGKIQKGILADDPVIEMKNLKIGEINTLDVDYKVIPKVSGVPILDTVHVKQTIEIDMSIL